MYNKKVSITYYVELFSQKKVGFVYDLGQSLALNIVINTL